MLFPHRGVRVVSQRLVLFTGTRSCRLIVAFPLVGAALGALRLLACSPQGTGVSLSDPSAVDAVILIRTSSHKNGAKTCCHCALPWLTSVTTHGTCVMIARITQHISLLLRRCSTIVARMECVTMEVVSQDRPCFVTHPLLCLNSPTKWSLFVSPQMAHPEAERNRGRRKPAQKHPLEKREHTATNGMDRLEKGVHRGKCLLASGCCTCPFCQQEHHSKHLTCNGLRVSFFCTAALPVTCSRTNILVP